MEYCISCEKGYANFTTWPEASEIALIKMILYISFLDETALGHPVRWIFLSAFVSRIYIGLHRDSYIFGILLIQTKFGY